MRADSLLTNEQCEYLRLVRQGKTSKEIAQLRGGSHHTVNLEIGIAMRILGASSRSMAANKLLALEDSGSYERSYEPDIVATSTEIEAIPDREEAGDADHHLPLPVPTGRRPTNELTTWQRIWWIITLATLVALLLGGLASGITAQLHGLSHWM